MLVSRRHHALHLKSLYATSSTCPMHLYVSKVPNFQFKILRCSINCSLISYTTVSFSRTIMSAIVTSITYDIGCSISTFDSSVHSLVEETIGASNSAYRKPLTRSQQPNRRLFLHDILFFIFSPPAVSPAHRPSPCRL